ncbi:MAG: hypothetical protein ACLT4C_04160 [Butyricicoccus sp.]
MDKLRKTIIRCTGFLCAAISGKQFMILPIASLSALSPLILWVPMLWKM